MPDPQVCVKHDTRYVWCSDINSALKHNPVVKYEFNEISCICYLRQNARIRNSMDYRLWNSNHQCTRREFITFQIYCHSGGSDALLIPTAFSNVTMQQGRKV